MPTSNRGSLTTLASKVFVASLVAMPIFNRPSGASQTGESAIRELNAGYVRAFMNSDADWYDKHLTPDFMCILATGATVDRKTFLDNARKPHTVIKYDLSEIGVRVHGDVALVTALGTWERKDGTTGQTRYIDVWVRANGTWKAVSAQLTAVN